MELPQFLLEKLKKQYAEEDIKRIFEGYNSKRAISLRINRIKTTNEEIEHELDSNHIAYEKVSWFQDAYILKVENEKVLWNLPSYQEGKIYLQSLSSMLPPLFLDVQGKDHILDMAAAPGGKTTEIASLTNNLSCITACELNPIRAEKLKFLVNKMGATRTTVLVTDARRLDEYFHFDKILLDAPCSGSGTILLSDEKIFSYFTEKLIEKSSKSQLQLLIKAIDALKVKGTLIYSTCSILQEENEEIVNKAIKGKKVHIEPISEEEIKNLPLLPSKIKGTLCVCPTSEYEGFFVAKIKKD